MSWSSCRLIVVIGGAFSIASPALVNGYGRWSEHEIENLISRESGWVVAGGLLVATALLRVWPTDGGRRVICIAGVAAALAIVLDIVVDTFVPMMLSRSAVFHVFDLVAFVALPLAIMNFLGAVIVVVRRKLQT